MHQKITLNMLQVWSCDKAIPPNDWILIPADSIYCPYCGKELKEEIKNERRNIRANTRMRAVCGRINFGAFVF